MLKLAVRQAIEEGADGVGTEHLLGGLLAEGNNLAIQVLRPRRRAPPDPPGGDRRAGGLVHLRAQTQAESQGPTAEQARLLSAAIQRELAPVLERLRRLEERLG